MRSKVTSLPTRAELVISSVVSTRVNRVGRIFASCMLCMLWAVFENYRSSENSWSTFLYMYVSLYVLMYQCVYIHMYQCMYICINVYQCMYSFGQKWSGYILSDLYIDMYKSSFGHRNLVSTVKNKWKNRIEIISLMKHGSAGGRWSGLPDFCWHNIPKNGGKYTRLPLNCQTNIKYTKWPQYIPCGHKMYRHFPF
jgi:hypothetical protein